MGHKPQQFLSCLFHNLHVKISPTQTKISKPTRYGRLFLPWSMHLCVLLGPSCSVLWVKTNNDFIMYSDTISEFVFLRYPLF